MAPSLRILVLLSHILVSQCQESAHKEDRLAARSFKDATPSYSFGYGVTNAETGDVKTAWEAKDGDTVKGHYSVLEPDGSVRTVEYHADGKTGFKAVVKNDGGAQQVVTEQTAMEDKSMRDYAKYESLFEHPAFASLEEKRRHRAKHPTDDEEYTPLSFGEYLKRYADASGRDEPSEEERHEYKRFPPYAKKKEHRKNRPKLSNVVDMDLTKAGKYPDSKYPDSKYPDNMSVRDTPYDLVKEASDMSKYVSPFSRIYEAGKYKGGKLDASDIYDYMSGADQNVYPEFDFVKHKRRPGHKKHPEYPFSSSNIDDDYVLVPKKKYPNLEYLARPPGGGLGGSLGGGLAGGLGEFDEDFDPHLHPEHEHDEKCKHKDKNKEIIVRKYVKKAKPVINLLDIFDI